MLPHMHVLTYGSLKVNVENSLLYCCLFLDELSSKNRFLDVFRGKWKSQQLPGSKPRTRTLGLCSHCCATELQRTDNHQPSHSSTCTAQVVLKCLMQFHTQQPRVFYTQAKSAYRIYNIFWLVCVSFSWEKFMDISILASILQELNLTW